MESKKIILELLHLELMQTVIPRIRDKHPIGIIKIPRFTSKGVVYIRMSFENEPFEGEIIDIK